jgi:hypothetical protein
MSAVKFPDESGYTAAIRELLAQGKITEQMAQERIKDYVSAKKVAKMQAEHKPEEGNKRSRADVRAASIARRTN